MTELKPCPFCGGEAKIARETHTPVPDLCRAERSCEYRAIPRPSINDGLLMECETCGARGPHEYTTPIQSRETAIAAWNNRVKEVER
jgi:Lar family restriction alleviation protein